jgi:hypothetical protein
MTTHNHQTETAAASGEAESAITRTEAPIAGTESTSSETVSTEPTTAESAQPGPSPAVTGGSEQASAESAATLRPEPTTAQSVGTEQSPARTVESDPSTAGTVGAHPSTEESLFGNDELMELRSRWDHVQSGFVDDPRECVQQADGLVSDVVNQLTTGFSEARSRLEAQWARGEVASTEDLRLALKRYREFFERLLAV